MPEGMRHHGDAANIMTRSGEKIGSLQVRRNRPESHEKMRRQNSSPSPFNAFFLFFSCFSLCSRLSALTIFFLCFSVILQPHCRRSPADKDPPLFFNITHFSSIHLLLIFLNLILLLPFQLFGWVISI